MEFQIGEKVKSQYHGLSGVVTKIGKPFGGRQVIYVKHLVEKLGTATEKMEYTSSFVVDGWELA